MKSSNKNSSKNPRFNYLILVYILVLVVSFAIPTFSRFKNRVIPNTIVSWDGSVASSYRSGSGTINDPYIISDGSELAYFSQELVTKDYDGVYFKLDKDIILNSGIFSYVDGKINYNIDGNTYDIDFYSDEYSSGNVNIFNSLNNFKGNFDGDYHRIYGLYITSEEEENLGLFTNLSGNVSNLYVENSLIYGANNTAGIASNANNASISNVLFNGYVIGASSTKESVNNVEVNDIIEELSSDYSSIIELNVPNYRDRIVSITLSGTYDVDVEGTTLQINNNLIEKGNFEIDLGNSYVNSLTINYSTTESAIFSLTNLKYNIKYKYANASGIVASGNNIKLDKVINKGYVYGNLYSSGIVADLTGNSSITNSYNIGNINSDNYTSGLVTNLSNSNLCTISKSYNNGTLNGINNASIIANVYDNQNVSINYVFNATNNTDILNTDNSNITVNNSYSISDDENSSFTNTTLEQLYDKTFMIDTLSYNEYDDSDNLENIWIYETNSLPILYIDDINNPSASINVSTYSWNNLSYDLTSLKFEDTIAFMISSTDSLNPLSEIYYYISNSRDVLTLEQIKELEYISYSDVVEISNEGYYVIYAKVVDYNGNISYLNTDLLILDNTLANVSIKIGDDNYTTYSNEPNVKYLDSSKNIIIEANDNLSQISNIYYYLSSDIITEQNINSITNSEWILYTDEVLFDSTEKIIYVKVVDEFGVCSYANTDKFIIDGYKQNTLSAGRRIGDNSDNVYITNKSALTFNYTYVDSNRYLDGYTHELISSILFPINTEITLIDNINNKKYKYVVNTSQDNFGFSDKGVAKYSLALFKEIGMASDVNYTNQYLDLINEDYTVIVDFKNTSITSNIEDAYLYMEIHDENDNVVRPTLKDSIKKYSVLLNSGPTVYLNTEFNETIEFNIDKTNSIDFNSGISYKYINENKVYDSSIEDKSINLAIKLVDSNNDIVSKEYLKNLEFKIGENNYYIYKDNVVHIKLDSGISDTNNVLQIITHEDNIKLSDGNYTFMIGTYISYDELIYGDIDYTVSIPVSVKNNLNDSYNFDVVMPIENKIITKGEELTLSFNILQKGIFEDPNIRVSLHKKDELSAYDQNYSRIDLATVVNNSLLKYTDSIYYASLNPTVYDGTENTYNLFEINLVTSKLENTGYKFVFELYDGDTLIGTIEKKFIVR